MTMPPDPFQPLRSRLPRCVIDAGSIIGILLIAVVVGLALAALVIIVLTGIAIACEAVVSYFGLVPAILATSVTILAGWLTVRPTKARVTATANSIRKDEYHG